MSAIRRRSLCCTCVHEEHCLEGRTPEWPVVHCEQFDCGRAPDRAGTRAVVAALSPVADPRFRGLCVNCDLRSECALPRPDGGVWHCEEYR